uniref:C-type lectin domain-containing protein n=1 Tax=Astyanax mexicanus TaxID=7994 RepID=A0A8B9KJW8_ASTMX
SLSAFNKLYILLSCFFSIFLGFIKENSSTQNHQYSKKRSNAKTNMTWEEALNYCRDTYTDLASLTSYQENALAVRKSTAAEVSHVWIGLHFVVRYWIWVDGHALEFKAWSEDEDPKCPARNLRCGALETDTNTWTPRNCGEKLNFLCYKK